MKRQFRRIVAGALIIMVSACTFMLGSGKSLANGTVKVSLLGKYDSADTATVRKVDTNTKQIQFRNFDTGKGYTLSYDNTSYMYDEYDKAISAALLQEGDICEITFLKSSKHLNSLIISKDAFVLNDVTDHDLIRGDDTAKINGKIYHLSNKALIMADGKPILAENVLDTDTIQVTGLDKEIYSIIVTKGHGYVSLSSDVVGKRSLVGAWLELDNTVIRKITPNMMVSAPEGTYTLSILGQGANYNSTVDVERNKETVIDTSVIPVEQPKEGQVTFEVTPDNAKVYVDGTQIITGIPQTFEYGVHKLQAFADGYDTFTRKLKVAQESAVIEINMEKTEDSSSTGSSSSNSNNSSNSSNKNSSNSSVKGASATKSNAGSSQNKTTTTADKSIATAASTGKSGASSTKASSSASTTSSTDDSSAAYTYVTTDASTSSSTESSTTVTTDDDEDDAEETYQIFVDAPVGAQLYLDGDYVGIIPTVFTRAEGKYMVTLAKSGYETKSYTISIDSSSNNSTYTFPDLVSEDSDSDDSGDSSTTNSSTDDSTSDTSADAATTDSDASNDDSDSDSTADTSSSDASNAGTKAVSGDDADDENSENDDSQSPDITSNSADENSENP